MGYMQHNYCIEENLRICSISSACSMQPGPMASRFADSEVGAGSEIRNNNKTSRKKKNRIQTHGNGCIMDDGRGARERRQPTLLRVLRSKIIFCLYYILIFDGRVSCISFGIDDGCTLAIDRPVSRRIWFMLRRSQKKDSFHYRSLLPST